MSHEVASNISSYNYWTDVTAQVRAKLDGAATGDVFFAIGEPDLFRVDGTVLAVVFDDPNVATTKSVALLFGALKTVGDQFAVGLEQPFTSTSQLEMSLGISFGFQPSTQYSTVSVNNQLITSAAGGQDDGIGANGGLITVGGVGDSPTNPANPNAAATSARSDDELYDLRPFVPLLSKNVVVKTSNPSNDDNIFLAAFVSDPPITTIATDSAPDWAAWSVGDVHAHASGDTSLLIHPACGGQTNPIGETACANKMVNDISLRAGRFGTDWLIFTEHAPWLGFLRQGQLGIYGKEQGERQWNAIVAAATAANGANGLSMLSGLELGTAAPACMHVTGASFNWLPLYERDAPLFDSPGHFGVYKTPTFIDNSIFDCNETGVNSYALDTLQAGGFGGVNHPGNKDRGSRWHCWNTDQSLVNSPVPAGREDQPVLAGIKTCSAGIDAYGQFGPTGTTAAGGPASFQTMEIVSGDNLPNTGTLDRWDAFTQNGLRVAAVGGGDGHTAPRKQNAKGILTCFKTTLGGLAVSAPQEQALLACAIDRGGEVKDPSVAKIGGSGRTLVAASVGSLAGQTPSTATHPVRTAISAGKTVATNGPRVLARVGSAGPGETVTTNSASVVVRVDWQPTFKHAGDAGGYCVASQKVSEKGKLVCPNSFRNVTFADIGNGGGNGTVAREQTAVPSAIYVVTGPLKPCGTNVKTCHKRMTRTKVPVDLAAQDRGYVTVNIPVGTEPSFVRTETYYDTGDSNPSDSHYIDGKLWDFGAFTSPTFLQPVSATSAARSIAPTPSSDGLDLPGARPSAALTGARALAPAATNTTAVTATVLDAYGNPVAGANVKLIGIDLLGNRTGTDSPSVTTTAAGTAVIIVTDGDWIPVATKPGCDQALQTPTITTPDQNTTYIAFDCHVADTVLPTATILSGPGPNTSTGSATFTLGGTDNLSGAQIMCMMDEVDADEFTLEICPSPITFNDLAGGQHVLQVAAVDVAGNISTVVTKTFFVNNGLVPQRRCGLCIVGQTGTNISATGNASLTVASGNIALGSSAANSIQAVGRSSVSATEASIVGPGHVSLLGGATVSPNLSPAIAATDPNPTLTIPAVPASSTNSCSITGSIQRCDQGTIATSSSGASIPDGNYAKIVLTGAGPVSIGPGRIGQLVVTGATTVVLRQGTYFFGSVQLTGNVTVKGQIVTAYITCGAPTCPQPIGLSLAGGALLSIEAPYNSVTPTLGLVVDKRLDSSISVTGNAKLDINGELHAPNAQLIVNAGTFDVGSATVRQITLVGNAIGTVRFDR